MLMQFKTETRPSPTVTLASTGKHRQVGVLYIYMCVCTPERGVEEEEKIKVQKDIKEAKG